MAKKQMQAKETEAKKASSAKKCRREVRVVSCPADFPISSRSSGRKAKESNRQQKDNFSSHEGISKNQKKLLDWHDTAKEIRSLGASAFVGQQKRSFEDEEYEFLTGRKKKKQKVPLPIVRGLKKKAEQRKMRQIKEAKEAGVVLPRGVASRTKKKKTDNTSRVHGPAPSAGFMKNGILRIKPA